ncbi:CvfB family protein [Flavobacterium selenitireducens]|uniref:CvfB family protein n=1 Tax=Flavobacterium selenitireducens TaxID=2722704 RepID=UPI00168B2341|nr:S1-like domain-containing RNA-binding protein [Flavobacterium selenitireducens]MBD3581075.1 GntR family transcriptional regulator [Flavobacterium selenitireducens]
MISIGKYNTLEILRHTRVGLFLGDGTEEVLLPEKYVPLRYEIGQEADVFVYLDHEERKVATTLEPYIYLNEFAYLRVNYINEFGAFLDWGMEKDLFCPFAEQARKMEQGKRYLVYLFLDEKSNRLVASSKTNQFLSNENLTVEVGEEVDLIVSHITEAGINVILNEVHKGLLFENEVFTDSIKPGQRLTGFVKKIRPGNKIDVSLEKIGYEKIEPNAEKILEKLKSGRGFLRLTDNSSPDDIKAVLQMSKKTFKKAVGALYKDRKIEIGEDGIRLVN